MTLIEALMAAFLVFVAGVVALNILMQAKSLALTSSDEADATLDLQAASWRITRELAESRPDGVTISTNPPGIAMVSARNEQGMFITDSYGNPIWQHYIIYWVEGSEGLYRAVVKPSQITGPMNQADFGRLNAQKGQRISRGVKHLTVNLDPDKGSADILMDWSEPGSLGKTEAHSLEFEVVLWN